MRSKLEIWRRHLWLWLVPGLFCLANLLVFGFYRYAYAGQVEALKERLGAEKRQLTQIAETRRELEGVRQRVELNDERVEVLREEHFATEAERFTRVVARIKTLVEKAGLRPTSYSYPSAPIRDQDLVRREIIFQVEGSYEQLRRLINFLELDGEFVTLEQISLDESSRDPRLSSLSISLRLSTVFVDPLAQRRSTTGRSTTGRSTTGRSSAGSARRSS